MIAYEPKEPKVNLAKTKVKVDSAGLVECENLQTGKVHVETVKNIE